MSVCESGRERERERGEIKSGPEKETKKTREREKGGKGGIDNRIWRKTGGRSRDLIKPLIKGVSFDKCG